jgi:hypothetical protein
MAGSVAWAQPANDNCSGALPLVAGNNAVDLTTATGGGSGVPCATFSPTADAWYTYTVPSTGVLRLQYAQPSNGGFPSIGMGVLSRCPDGNGNVFIACARDTTATVPTTVATLDVIAGTTYTIVLSQSFGRSTVPGTLSVEMLTPPTNDTCNGATNIPFAVLGSNTYDTSSAATNPNTTCPNSDPDFYADVWYRFRSTAAGDYVVYATSQTNRTPALSVRANNCGASITPFACDNGEALLTFPATANTTYRLRIGGREEQGSRGAGTFEVRLASSLPAGDLCSTALPATLGSTTIDLSAMTKQTDVGCNSGPVGDAFFVFTPPEDGVYTFNACNNSGSDVGLSVRSDCLESSELACRSFADCEGTQGIELPAGVPVTIVLAGTGSATLTINAIAAPANDDCSAAMVVGNGSHEADLRAATSSTNSVCGYDNIADAWFQYTATQSGIVRVSTCDENSSAFIGPAVAIYSDCGSSAPIACATDQGVCPSFLGAEAYFEAVQGQTYTIQIAETFERPSAPSQFSITPLSPPSNDSCSSPEIVTTQTSLPYDISGATTDLPLACGQYSRFGASEGDVWFRYIPSFTGRATVATCDNDYEGTLYNPVISLHPACGQPPTRCNDSDCTETGRGSISFNVTSGSEYLIRVAGVNYGGGAGVARGTGVITFAQRTSNFPAGDECSAPRTLTSAGLTWNNVPATTNVLGLETLRDDITKDLWFRYTAASNGVALITTCPPADAERTTRFAIYDTCADTTPLLSQEAPSCPGGAIQFYPVSAGSPILIRAGTSDVYGAGSNNTISVQLLPPVPNDRCANAQPIGLGTHTTELRGSFRDGLSLCDNFLFALQNDVWYTFVAPRAGRVQVKTCDTLAAGLQGVAFSLHSSCNEQTASCLNGSCLLSQNGAQRVVDAGETVLIRVGSYAPATLTGPVQFEVEMLDCGLYTQPAGAIVEAELCNEPTPANAGCGPGGAIPLTFGQAYAGLISSQINTSTGDIDDDVDAYGFELTTQTTITITAQSLFDSKIRLSDVTACVLNGSDRETVAFAIGLGACSDVVLTKTLPPGKYEVSVEYRIPTLYEPLSCSDYWFRVDAQAGCNSIDFNGDGLFPDDNDLIDFLSVLAGGPCSTGSCGSIDFNNDGLFPDDNDLVTFLRVLAGGDC